MASLRQNGQQHFGVSRLSLCAIVTVRVPLSGANAEEWALI
jgi:hypothetical protein